MSDQDPEVAPTEQPPETPPTIEPEPAPGVTVYLPQIIANEYAMLEANARDTVLTGKITVDGEEWMGDKLYLPRDLILDKEIVVESPFRSVRFSYHG